MSFGKTSSVTLVIPETVARNCCIHNMSTILSGYTLVSDSRILSKMGRKMGRPKKDPKDTYKGKREEKKIAKMKLREEKGRLKQEKKQLAVDGNIAALCQVNQEPGEKIFKTEPESNHDLEFEFEVKPKPEQNTEQNPESYLTFQPIAPPVKSLEDSLMVKIKGCMTSDLEFGSLDQDTAVHCQDGSVPAPSLLLALLAPWLGEVLRPGRGQQDSSSNILCPDLKAASLRMFLDEVAAMKEEIVVNEDVKCVFLMNHLKHSTQDIPEIKIKLKDSEELNKNAVGRKVIKHKSKKKRCNVCQKKWHRSNYHSTIPAICENCGNHFRNKYTLKHHSIGCRDGTPCPICGKLVKQMKQHTDMCHTSDLDKKWRCDHCGKGFLGQRRMEIHANSHLKLKPYKCRKGCERGFTDPAHRGRHEKRVHKDDTIAMAEKLEQYPGLII